MSFCEYMCSRFGAKWVVAGRLTPRLKAKGYEVAITQRAYSKLYDAWEAGL